MRDAIENTTSSMIVPPSADNFGEMVINKRSKKLSMLDSIDQNKQITTLDEIDSRMNYGYRQVA